MSSLNNVNKPRGSRRLAIAGVILIALALVGAITWIVIASTQPPSADPQETGAAQSLIVIGSAICAGTGAVLLSLGLIKGRRSGD